MKRTRAGLVEGQAMIEVEDNDASSLLSRSISILEHVAHAGRPISVAELVRTLDLPKPTAHRICKTLESMGVLIRDPYAKGIVVGPRLSQLALDTMLASADNGARRAILRSVVEETGETCTLTTMDGDELLFLDRVESASPLRLQLHAGSRVPLYCTSAGKLFLAFLPKGKRKRFIRSLHIEKRTENTITDPARLEEALEAIRRSQIGTDNEEYLYGLVATAVPVFDGNRMCAAVSINGPVGRVVAPARPDHVKALRRVSAELSAFFQRSVGRAKLVSANRGKPSSPLKRGAAKSE